MELSLSATNEDHILTYIRVPISQFTYHLYYYEQVTKPLLETSRRGYLAALSASSYSYVSLLKHFAPFINPGKGFFNESRMHALILLFVCDVVHAILFEFATVMFVNTQAVRVCLLHTLHLRKSFLGKILSHSLVIRV